MEKFDKLQQNKVSDEELDQISGGKNFFDIFTTEYRGGEKKPTTLEMDLDEEEKIKVSTLDLRTNPLEKKDTKKTKRIVKL